MLINKKVIILVEYSDFIDIFLKKLVIKLYKYLDINKYIIGPKIEKQLSYKLIYSLTPIELETFKTYIKKNLVNSFISLFTSLIEAFILFLEK